MRLEALILLILYFLCINCAEMAADKHVIENFNDFDDFGGCPWIELHLPERFKMIVLNERNLSISDDYCETTQGYTEGFDCQQTKNSTGYIATAQICDGKKYFRIGWELENFHVENRITQITQFVATAGDWNSNNMSCIQPQYSLPLVRESVVGNETMVMCAIRLDLCCNFEAVVIFGLTEPFCEYNDQVQTCDREVLDNDTIVFSKKIPKEANNKYYPDQYVFCNSMGSYMSTRIIWDTSTDFEDNLSAVAVNTTAIEVSWKPPKHVAPDLVYRLTVGTNVADIKERGFNGLYIMGGLTPDTNYKVSVCLVFRNPDSLAPCITTSVSTRSLADRPVGVWLVALSSTAVLVLWEYPMNRNQQFDDYRLNISDGVGSQLVGVGGRIVVKGLTPSTSYQMTLEAKYAGVDKFGEPVRRSVTTPPTGADLPTNLKAWAVNATAVEVRMDLPKHKVSDGFYVMTVGTQVAKIPAYGFGGVYTMGGLAEDTIYKVTVCLIFKNPDFSAGCIETTVTTQPKDDRPVGVWLVALSSTAVLVVWEHPKSRNQKFDDYRLNISDGIASQLVNGGGRIVIKDLQPSTSYEMTLEAKYAGTDKFGKEVEISVTTLPTGFFSNYYVSSMH